MADGTGDKTLSGSSANLTWEIRHRPSYSTLYVTLGPGGSIIGQAGAMVTHSDGLDSETRMGAGCLMSIVRKVFGGESLFVTEYKGPGSVVLAPTLPGDVFHIPMKGGSLLTQGGAFLASTPQVTFSPVFGGCRSFFGGEGAFLLNCSGSGDLFLECYGAIEEIDIDGTYVIDTGHMVAWEPSLNYRLKSVGGCKSFFFSGEGAVFEFSGKGKAWIQTRNVGSFVSWLSPHLPR